MRHLKKQNIVCFTPLELKELYKNDKREKLNKTLAEKGIRSIDLVGDNAKQVEVVDAAIKKDLKNKEQIEIFSALNSCIVFYDQDSEIGFPLKDSYSVEKSPIQSMESLKAATKEGSFIDFAIVSGNLINQFQYKLYKGILETEEFLDFIEKVLKKYGNKLEKVNLLIMLQGVESTEVQKINIDFNKVRDALNSKKIDFGVSILVRFNERNKFNYLVEVYPGKYAVKTPINPEYLAGKLLYD
jgi:hypothetical protein